MVALHHDRGAAYPRDRQHEVLDFAEFDAVAPEVHLTIIPSEELHVAVFQPTRHVPGIIHHGIALPLGPRENVRDENLRGLFLFPPIPLGDIGAAYEQTPGDAQHARLHLFIQDVIAGILHGLADRDDIQIAYPVLRGDGEEAHRDGGLRRPIFVDHLMPRIQRHPLGDVGRVDHFAAKENTHPGVQLGRGVHERQYRSQHAEMRRGDVEEGDGFLFQEPEERLHVPRILFGENVQRSPAHQRPEVAGEGHVKGRRGDKGETFPFPAGERPQDVIDEIAEVGVGNDDAFGLARRPGRVDHIGGIVLVRAFPSILLMEFRAEVDVFSGQEGRRRILILNKKFIIIYCGAFFIKHEHMRHAGAFLQIKRAQRPRSRHQQSGLAVINHIMDSVRGIRGGHRHVRRPGFERGKLGQQEIAAARKRERDKLPAPDAAILEKPGHARRTPIKFSVCERNTFEGQRFIMGPHKGMFMHETVKRFRPEGPFRGIDPAQQGRMFRRKRRLGGKGALGLSGFPGFNRVPEQGVILRRKGGNERFVKKILHIIPDDAPFPSGGMEEYIYGGPGRASEHIRHIGYVIRLMVEIFGAHQADGVGKNDRTHRTLQARAARDFP